MYMTPAESPMAKAIYLEAGPAHAVYALLINNVILRTKISEKQWIAFRQKKSLRLLGESGVQHRMTVCM
jgi:hypothetical protein